MYIQLNSEYGYGIRLYSQTEDLKHVRKGSHSDTGRLEETRG